MSLSISALLSILLFGLFELHLTHGVLPGAKVRFTNAAFDYGVVEALNKFKRDLIGKNIPQLSGGGSWASYKVTGLYIAGLDVDSSSLRTVANKNVLRLTLGGISLTIKGNYAWKLGKSIFTTRGGDKLKVSSSGIRLEVDLGIAANSGRPVIQGSACSCKITSLKPTFSGNTGILLTALSRLFQGVLIKKVEEKVCSPALSGMNKAFTKIMNKLKLTTPIFKTFSLDYGLVANPQFKSEYIETYHKGEIFWTTDPALSVNLASPKPFPPFAGSSRMVYIWLSEYVANSFSYAAFTKGFFHYNRTSSQMPTAARSFLKTSCGPKKICFGTIFPHAAELFPNSNIMLEITASKPPQATITPNKLTGTALGTVKLYAMSAGKTPETMLHLGVTVVTSANGYVRNNILYAKASDLKLSFTLIKSEIGSFTGELLSVLVNPVLDKIVKPKLNNIGAKGFALPVSGAIGLKKANISLVEGSILIESDVIFKG